MKYSRRGRIIQLINEGKNDNEIMSLLEREFPPGTFVTSNMQALYGTKRDLRLEGSNQVSRQKIYQPRFIIPPAAYSRNKLVQALQDFQSEPVIDRYVRKELSGKSPNGIVSFTMGNSICRAFRYESPSQRYKNWRWYGLGKNLIEHLEVIETPETFDSFVMELGKSLVADWGPTNERGEPSRMNIGIALKIVNLLLKHTSFSEHCKNERVIEFLHVPWDRFTLSPLRDIWSDTPPIPDSPSQGFVKTLETYEQLHALITGITSEAGVPRIVYEFWAWDAAH